MRIMTNYLQVVSVALAINADYPKMLTNIFLPADTVGSTSESFVSLDCFITDTEMNFFTPSATVFKIFLTSLLPLMLIGFYCVVWGLLYLIAKKWCNDIKRNIFVSVVVVLYFLHPALVKAGLRVFQCVEVNEGDLRARVDLDIDCYSPEHLKWITLVGLPNVIIWGVGIPASSFSILFKYRLKLYTSRIQKYMLMIYQGLRQECFYWEFMNTIRKVLLLSAVTFMATYSLKYRVLACTVILISALRIQIKLRPYKKETNNQLELNEITTGTLTLFASMVYDDEGSVPGINLIVFVLSKCLHIQI